jgi:hypothetical protein
MLIHNRRFEKDPSISNPQTAGLQYLQSDIVSYFQPNLGQDALGQGVHPGSIIGR